MAWLDVRQVSSNNNGFTFFRATSSTGGSLAIDPWNHESRFSRRTHLLDLLQQARRFQGEARLCIFCSRAAAFDQWLANFLDQGEDVPVPKPWCGRDEGLERTDLLPDPTNCWLPDHAIESAAPPRASPSNLVKIVPSMATASSKAWATLTASCPVMASTTRKV